MGGNVAVFSLPDNMSLSTKISQSVKCYQLLHQMRKQEEARMTLSSG